MGKMALVSELHIFRNCECHLNNISVKLCSRRGLGCYTEFIVADDGREEEEVTYLHRTQLPNPLKNGATRTSFCVLAALLAENMKFKLL